MRRSRVLQLAVVTGVLAGAAFVTHGPEPSRAQAHPPKRVAGMSGARPSVRVRRAVRYSVSPAVRRRPIPADLVPPIGALAHDAFDVSACSAHDGSSSPICHWGDPTARRKMVVLGDSHAQMWMPAAIAFAKLYHKDLVPLVKLGCVPVHFNKGVCGAWYRWALGEIRRMHPRLIVLSEFWAAWGAPGASAMRREFADVRGLARRVVLLEDPPTRTQTALDCLRAPGATLGRCTFPVTDRQRSTYRSVQASARAWGVRYVGTRRWLCWRRRCPTVVLTAAGNFITYRDKHHVALTYASLFKYRFALRIKRALG